MVPYSGSMCPGGQHPTLTASHVQAGLSAAPSTSRPTAQLLQLLDGLVCDGHVHPAMPPLLGFCVATVWVGRTLCKPSRGARGVGLAGANPSLDVMLNVTGPTWRVFSDETNI